MSDLPARIWVDGVFHVWKYDPAPAIGYKEYLRADLLPTIEELVDIIAIEEDAYKLADAILKRIGGDHE